MKITDYSPLSKTSATRKKGGVSSSSAAGNFLGLLTADDVDNVQNAAAPSDMQPVASMEGLLSLQEIPDDELRKRKAAVQEGEGTLEALETLRHALLAGEVPEHLLHTLNKVVSLQKQRVDDPRLMSIIEDIELRAAVELAKLERASHQS